MLINEKNIAFTEELKYNIIDKETTDSTLLWQMYALYMEERWQRPTVLKM